MTRCDWAKSGLEIPYHDLEWGKPKYDDAMLFEMLILEGMQAGLSWSTILAKRENYRQALDGFDPQKIKDYDQDKLDELPQNAGLIRNRLKMQAIVKNAKAFIQVQTEFGSFSTYLWQYVSGKPIQHDYHHFSEVPATTPISEKMSKDMKKRGFSFVGPTICYAYMQSVGLVNDHLVSCDYR
ncbi:DNA-3-methyladenine glycosylase I [Lactococcus laudensis]|uniref:DNA-3-methyladenine glycosylase I n=1 Tax=Pseudolactococcus laudensis TaxID=1494461 RepID=A0A7V8SJY6_9LACT|nr:DNA-3-methyladenine glycosylase I [Lactococcus laudensis]MBA0016857.1 DNA-3-methyladenine glycosylase I [Lactococcus laudensis]MBQ6145184.1 DNA-3-methyladenine glycosylase I [Lactococcus sp.]MBR2764292.1 DNA-3-methyladenine glycosylase I [Lactococcus sp.]MBW9281559.1 DNA-3-methyladenine glycosylase I [Lactococcus laudensis]